MRASIPEDPDIRDKSAKLRCYHFFFFFFAEPNEVERKNREKDNITTITKTAHDTDFTLSKETAVMVCYFATLVSNRSEEPPSLQCC